MLDIFFCNGQFEQLDYNTDFYFAMGAFINGIIDRIQFSLLKARNCFSLENYLNTIFRKLLSEKLLIFFCVFS